jgi:hypothetical protein
MLELHLLLQARTVLMTVDLQNRIMYVFGVAVTAQFRSIMPLTDLLQLLVRGIKDIGRSFIHIAVAVSHVTVALYLH